VSPVLVAERYRLGEPLGRGGMGEVYRATDEVLDRQIAIKLLLPVRESLAAEKRFLREARAAAMISDPHVVAALDFGKHGDGYFLAMELVEGQTVREELSTHGPLPPDRAVDIVRQAAAGLAAAHRHGLVHRDIKPGNLLLTSDGRVKVADFGIVRFADTTTTLTATGEIVGTTQFLAPERALGQTAEAASDVYALGCVLYQLVTGHPPFVADDPTAIMYQHVEMTPARPSVLRPQLAGEFEDLLYWMLAKDPNHRPTASQVADGVVAPAFVDDAPTSVVAESQPATVPAASPLPPGRRRASRIVLAGLAAAIIAVSATTIAILSSNLLKPPATSDHVPHTGITTPAAKPRANPSTPRTVRPTSTAGEVGSPHPTTPPTTRLTTAPTTSPTAGQTSSPTAGQTTPPTTPPNSPPTTPAPPAPTSTPTTAPTPQPTPGPTTPPPTAPSSPAKSAAVD
jgi:serine/threonine-protein kinase